MPIASCPASALRRAPSTCSRIQATFGPQKYVASGSPTRSRYRSWSPPPSRSISGPVRVSCHTIALPTGSPVLRSQTTVVSRWLVIPTAARCWKLT